MSFLTDNLPSRIEIGGACYPIRTDFRAWLEFDSIMNGNLPSEKKIAAVMRMCFPYEEMKSFPPPSVEAFSELLKFYNGGKEGKNGKKSEPVLSFTHDAELIYSAFLSEYNIDLLSVPYLHWFCFLALFHGLSEESRIMKIIAIRSISLDKIKNQTEREHYRRLKEIYALPYGENSCERDSDIANSLFQMF